MRFVIDVSLRKLQACIETKRIYIGALKKIKASTCLKPIKNKSSHTRLTLIKLA